MAWTIPNAPRAMIATTDGKMAKGSMVQCLRLVSSFNVVV